MKEVEIPFSKEFEHRMLLGRKRATTRNKKYGEPGDIFHAFGTEFILLDVVPMALGDVGEFCFGAEGFDCTTEFVLCWNRLHPRKKYDPYQKVWYHTFERVL